MSYPANDPATRAKPAADAPASRRGSLALRVLKWTVIVLAALVVVIAGVLLWPGTREWAFGYGRSILEEAGVRSSSITGDWTEMTLHDVAIVDSQGVWATADEIVLSWSPWGLASFTLDADRVVFKGAHVLRPPAYTPAPDQADEPFAWPDLPVDIALGSLTGDITIDPSLAGEAVSAGITGTASLTASGGSAEVALTRTDGVLGEASITAETDAKLSDLSIAINAKDARVLAGLAGEPRLANLEVALQTTRNGQTCSGQAAISARDGALVSLGVNPDCTFALTLAEVSRLLPPSAGLLGPANLSLQLREDGSDKTTHILVAADLSKLQSTDATIARLLPGASLTGLVRFTADGVRLDDLAAQLGDGALTLTGWASQAGERLQVEADLAAKDLAVLRPDLAGAADAHLTYDSTAATPIAVRASGTNIASGSLSWPTLSLQGAVDAAGSGQVALKGDGATPIDLAVALANAFGDAPAIDARGVVVSARVEAKTTTSPAGNTITAIIETDRLDRLGALAGVDLAGSLKADITAQLGDAPAIDLTATFKGARAGATAIGDARVAAKGPLSALAVDVSGTTQAAGPAIAYKTAAVISNFAEARVTALSLKAGEAGLDTTQPFTVAFGTGVAVDGLDARLSRAGRPAGRIAGTATQSAGGGLKSSLQLAALDLEALTAVLGRASVKGQLDATASLDLGAGGATLDGRIARLNVGGAPPADIVFKGDWNGARFALVATAATQGLPDARAELAFPLARPPGGGFPSPSPNAPLAGTVSWSGRVAPIWRLVDLGGHDLDGDADIQAKIAGTLSAPKINGTAALANGRYANDLFGTRLAALTVNAALEGDRVTIKGSATDGRRGRLVIDMTMTTTGGYGAASGGVTLTTMQLLANDDLSARFDGALKLAPGANGPVLGGALTVTNLNAGIPEGQAADLVTVDVIDPGKPRPAARAGAPAASRAAPVAPVASDTLALDIDVLIPGPAKVGGRGLNSLWKGDLKIFGDASDPRIRGKLSLLRGTLDFGSRSFALSDGEIEFDGGPTIEPRIDLTASVEEEGITASLVLSGRATAPTVTASSVPARPQDEVFALLLFGRSVTKLSALEGLELANSIAALSGGTDLRGSVLGDLRNRFGLDVLAVDLGENGQASVRAGSYLANNVYFELRQGGAQGGTTGRVEIQIDDNISVETEVGADSSSSVGARYKLDY